MDWLTFICEVVKAVASWPVAIFAIFFIYKNELRELLPQLTRLKWKDLELDFAKGVERAKNQADKYLPPDRLEVTSFEQIRATDSASLGTVEGASISTAAPTFEEFAKLSPAAAVLQAWLVLEKSLREAAERNGIPSSDRSTTLKLAEELYRQQKINRDTLDIFKQVRDLRNKVVHMRVDALTTSRALEYESITSKLAAVFKKL
jgi:hypothetical protein